MKKNILLVIIFITSMMTPSVQGAELIWYLGSAMSKAAPTIVAAYQAEYPQDRIVVVTRGSGQLLSKIMASGRGDIYTPTSESFYHQAQQQQLVSAGRPLLKQFPVFAISPHTSRHLSTFDSLMLPDVHLAIGNPKTMALGRTYQRIAAAMPESVRAGIAANRYVDSLNITQTLGYLHAGIVDAGLVFDATARQNKLEFIAIPDSWNVPSTAWVAQLNCTKHPQEAQRFFNFLLNNAVFFEQNGFQVVRQ